MDMWKPFRNVTHERAPQAAILFDKFHVMRHLGEAMDKVRVIQRRAYGLRGEEYLRLKILTCILPPL